MIHLVRDLLDRRIVDAHGVIVGRVDGVELEVDPSGPPRVSTLLVGGSIPAARIGAWARRLAIRGRRRLGRKRPTLVRIPWRDVDHLGRDVRLLESARASETRFWERWIRDHIVDRLPGGSRK